MFAPFDAFQKETLGAFRIKAVEQAQGRHFVGQALHRHGHGVVSPGQAFEFRKARGDHAGPITLPFTAETGMK
jgi:hypothetical protein